MTDLCMVLEKEHSHALTLKDLSGDGIIRCKTYLEKVCLLTFPSHSKEWQEVLKFNTIRNLIVHCEGRVKIALSPPKSRNTIENSPGLGLNSHEEVIVEPEYVLKAIYNVRNLLKILYVEAFSGKSDVSPRTAHSRSVKSTRKR